MDFLLQATNTMIYDPNDLISVKFPKENSITRQIENAQKSKERKLFIAGPQANYMKATLRILKYLKGIWYTWERYNVSEKWHVSLQAYIDAKQAYDSDRRKSAFGYFTLVEEIQYLEKVRNKRWLYYPMFKLNFEELQRGSQMCYILGNYSQNLGFNKTRVMSITVTIKQKIV